MVPAAPSHAQGGKQGPFAFAKMVKYGRKTGVNEKGEPRGLPEGLRVQDERTACWVPLWYLLLADDNNQANHAAGALICWDGLVE